MVQKGHEQQYCHGQRERRVHQREQYATHLDGERGTRGYHCQNKSSNSFTDEPDHGHEVIEVVEQLGQALHSW